MLFAVVQAAAIDTIARDALASYRAPGAAIAVVRDGKVIRISGFGTRDCAGGPAPGPHTRFEIGSLTKQFVATLAMQYVDEGRIDPSAPVTAYVPEARAWRGISVRELLDQRSGIADFNGGWFLARHLGSVWPGHVDRARLLAGLETEPLTFPADARFDYSNANYLMLGTILEHVAKRDLGSLLHDRILGPLDLADTGLGIPSGGDAASGCGTTPWGVARVPSFDPELTWAAGGMYSSAADMARFEIALLGARLFSPARLREMLAARDGYGFAWFVYPNGSDRIAWHDGTVYGYKAAVVAIPVRHDVVVVLANADYFHAARVATQVADVTFGTSMPVAEGFDPALPPASLAIGGLSGAFVLAFALLLKRRVVVGIAGGAAAYCVASLAWPAAIAVALVAVLLVLAPMSRTSRSTPANSLDSTTRG